MDNLKFDSKLLPYIVVNNRKVGLTAKEFIAVAPKKVTGTKQLYRVLYKELLRKSRNDPKRV